MLLPWITDAWPLGRDTKALLYLGDDLVDLIGARLITVSETEEGQSLAEAKIKQMTGGDTLKGRPLYGTYVQFSIIGKL